MLNVGEILFLFVGAERGAWTGKILRNIVYRKLLRSTLYSQEI